MLEVMSFRGELNASETDGNTEALTASGSPTTPWSAADDQSDTVSEMIIQYGQLIYPPILLAICLFGNTLNFIVIGKVCAGSSISVYFRWLAVADTLAACTYLSRIWINAAFKVLINCLNDAACKLINFTNYTAGDVAIWIMVAVTADRLVAIIKPFLARRLCSAKCARICALCILIMTVAKNATVLVSFAVVKRGKEIKCGYQNDHPLTYFEKHVRPLLTLTMSGIVPVFFILILNSAVVVQLGRHRRQMKRRCAETLVTKNTAMSNTYAKSQEAANSKQLVAKRKRNEAAAKKKSSESAAIAIVLANSIMFFIMVLPQFVVNLFKQVPYADELRAVQVFTTFLMYCNHSFNFYISYLASRAYRRKVRQTFNCGHPDRPTVSTQALPSADVETEL